MISKLEFSFLCACQEIVLRQQVLIPLLAEHFGVKPNQVVFYWLQDARQRQIGIFGDGEWKYFFHGFECDIENTQDGRFLRVDFGPKGRLDTFASWGVLQFVMLTKSPWQDFPALRAYLAENPPPYNKFSGSYEKAIKIMNHLEKEGLVEVSDKSLYEIAKKNLSVIPQESDGYTLFDLDVCHRLVISPLGKQILQDGKLVLK